MSSSGFPAMPAGMFAYEHRCQVLRPVVRMIAIDVVNHEAARQELVMGKLPDKTRAPDLSILASIRVSREVEEVSFTAATLSSPSTVFHSLGRILKAPVLTGAEFIAYPWPTIDNKKSASSLGHARISFLCQPAIPSGAHVLLYPRWGKT